MAYKNENIKHRQGYSSFTHKCPHCEHKMKFNKLPFMVICGKCDKPIKGEDLKKK